jgi:hypothetical protein
MGLPSFHLKNWLALYTGCQAGSYQLSAFSKKARNPEKEEKKKEQTVNSKTFPSSPSFSYSPSPLVIFLFRS